MVAEVKDHIVKEKAWMDEDLPQRESPNDVFEGSYRKEFEIIQR